MFSEWQAKVFKLLVDSLIRRQNDLSVSCVREHYRSTIATRSPVRPVGFVKFLNKIVWHFLLSFCRKHLSSFANIQNFKPLSNQKHLVNYLSSVECAVLSYTCATNAVKDFSSFRAGLLVATDWVTVVGLVCVEPRTSALNTTLPAARAPPFFVRYLLPAPKLRQAADVDRRDRQTDIRPLHTLHGALHAMRAALFIKLLMLFALILHSPTIGLPESIS